MAFLNMESQYHVTFKSTIVLPLLHDMVFAWYFIECHGITSVLNQDITMVFIQKIMVVL